MAVGAGVNLHASMLLSNIFGKAIHANEGSLDQEEERLGQYNKRLDLCCDRFSD